jgi:DNA polymerase V
MLVALVDANNFYVSCERVFRPDLERRPVIVLSNNDGCIISRSNEAKALGIGMAVPFFKVRDLVRQGKVTVFSSNYPLYGDMSRRMNETLMAFSPDIEPYSIDESFVGLTGVERAKLIDYGQDLRATMRRWTGLPVCVGIGPTKTLAKLANVCAKKMPEFAGVCDLSDAALRERAFRALPAREVWGIGHSAANTLTDLGIHTVADLCAMDAGTARRALSIVGSRLIWELRGEPCFTLETIPQPRKGVSVTRSFGNRITAFSAMSEAITTFATRAAEKLREDGMAASHITVFMRTTHHPKPADAFTGYANSRTVSFITPTCDTREMAQAALKAAEAIWKDGYRFAKAGVYLGDLMPFERVSSDLFNVNDREESKSLMKAIDGINNRHSRNGRDAIFLAASGIRQHWRHRSDQRSPGYTTSFTDLRRVRA